MLLAMRAEMAIAGGNPTHEDAEAGGNPTPLIADWAPSRRRHTDPEYEAQLKATRKRIADRSWEEGWTAQDWERWTQDCNPHANRYLAAPRPEETPGKGDRRHPAGQSKGKRHDAGKDKRRRQEQHTNPDRQLSSP